MCDGFELAINSLHASSKYDIYVTASNAFLASSDLATLFVGREFPVEVYPFIYLQVSYDISTAETLEREVAPLLAVKDAYPKLLLTRTRQPEQNYEGVRIIDIADWLMGE